MGVPMDSITYCNASNTLDKKNSEANEQRSSKLVGDIENRWNGIFERKEMKFSPGIRGMSPAEFHKLLQHHGATPLTALQLPHTALELLLAALELPLAARGTNLNKAGANATVQELPEAAM